MKLVEYSAKQHKVLKSMGMFIRVLEKLIGACESLLRACGGFIKVQREIQGEYVNDKIIYGCYFADFRLSRGGGFSRTYPPTM